MSDSKSKKPMTASDYIKNQPHLQGKPLTIQNHFSALAEFPPLSYSKAVITNKGQSSIPTQNTPQETTQKSTYYTKPQKQHLMTTQFTKPISLKELQTFTKRVFYDDNLYPTDNLTKNQTFYEFILVDSKSAEITHYPDKTNPNLISYSTCKILKIASIQDLGFIHHHTTKSFSNPGYHIPGYSYIDYQNAFFRTFYLRSYDHSWFISFDHKCPKTIPGWFNEWWHWFGPSETIYPETVLKTSLPYYLKHIPPQPIGPLAKISFHIDMGIPWICSWHFNLTLHLPDMPYSLIREFRIKWWDKYNLTRCALSNIQHFFEVNHQLKTTIKAVSKSIPLVTPDQLIQQASPPKSTKHTAHSSPAHSSTSSNSKPSSKKDKMKKILALIEQQLDSSDDEENMQDADPYGGPLSQFE